MRGAHSVTRGRGKSPVTDFFKLYSVCFQLLEKIRGRDRKSAVGRDAEGDPETGGAGGKLIEVRGLPPFEQKHSKDGAPGYLFPSPNGSDPSTLFVRRRTAAAQDDRLWAGIYRTTPASLAGQ